MNPQHTMRIEIKHRYTRSLLFSEDIQCDNENIGVLLGLAVRTALDKGTNLAGADLSGADLSGADLSGADLSGADLSGADLAGAFVPLVKCLDRAIYDSIIRGGVLDMLAWHTCETTHCRAGWAVYLAGNEGRLLESLIGTNAAAALIYTKSRPGKRVPDFYAPNDVAFDDIKKCAEECL